MNNMKRLFWIFLFTLNFTDITAQSFYDMLRETMDSTYVDIINRSSKSNYKERFKYNNIYEISLDKKKQKNTELWILEY